jgi:hypothetical protein
MCLHHVSQFAITKYTILLCLYSVGPILAQREAYVNLWSSCQIGDAYIDLSIYLFDAYTTSKENAAPPLNPNLTPHDDRTWNLFYSNDYSCQKLLHEEHWLR